MAERIKALKGRKKITALTAYDYPTARILSEAGIDLILVGDSLGMVVLGYETTRFVTMEDMIRHTQAVMRGCRGSLVVADMPIGSYDTVEKALENCQRMVKETGVRAVKIEGNPEIVARVGETGIAVMGHTGLKPQTAEKYGLRGREEKEARQIFKEALALEKAGCFALVLECVPAKLAREITRKLKIPTIGIGAGPDCDGQILVLPDILGLFPDFKPRFVRRYANLGEEILKAVKKYKNEVERRKFPSSKESF